MITTTPRRNTLTGYDKSGRRKLKRGLRKRLKKEAVRAIECFG